LEKKILIADIAKARGLAEGTIVSHIEKMSASGQEIDIEYLKPSPEIFKKRLKNAEQKHLAPFMKIWAGNMIMKLSGW